MSKTTNKFSPEVRERAVRMVEEHRSEYPSEWAALTSIAGKIGCTTEPAPLVPFVGRPTNGTSGAGWRRPGAV